MIRRKNMLIFKAILVVSALCLVAPSEAGGQSCVCCDPGNCQKYTQCVFGNLITHPECQNLKPTLVQMKSDLLKMVKDISKDGPIKDNAMKGALVYSLGSLLGQEKDSNKKTAVMLNILKQCFVPLRKNPDTVFLNECAAIAKEQSDLSNSQQPEDQTESDKLPETIQNATNPIQNDNVPQTEAMSMPTSLSNDKINPSQKKKPWNPVSPDKQNTYPYDNQQQYSGSAASAYAGQQKNQWNGSPYNIGPAQRQNFYQQPTRNQGNAYAVASASSSAASSAASSDFFYESLPKQQQPTLYRPKTQQKQPVNAYNQQQNYPGNPNAYPNANRGAPLDNVNNQGYPQTPVTTDDGANSQVYGDNLGYYLQNQNPNINNWRYSQDKYPDNQFDWSNYQTDTSSSAYSSTGQQNKNFNNLQYPSLTRSAPPQAVPQNNYAYSYSRADSSAASSSSPTNNAGSYALSSSYSNSNSPDSNQQYPLPETIQRNPKLNVLTPGNKPQPDTKQQDVPSVKDDKTSKATEFSKTLYGNLCDAPCVKNVINEKTTKNQLQPILKYVLLYALSMCGYPKEIAQKCSDDSNNFTNGMPQGLPTPIQVKAICEMMKMQFISKNMIGDNPAAQAQCLGEYMKDGLKKIQKSPASPEPQQNLSNYPTENVPYDDSNPNNYAPNQQIIGIPNKEKNNNGQYLDDNPTSQIYPNKKSEPSKSDDYNGYPATQTPHIGKQPYVYDKKGQSSAGAEAYAGADNNYKDDGDYYEDDGDYYEDDYDDDDYDGKISPQDPNSPQKQQNKPNIYNVNYQSADDKLKQQSNQPQWLDYQQQKLKDNEFAKNQDKPTYLRNTDTPPLQPYPSDVPQKPDSKENATAVNCTADSKERVKMLMKLTLACYKDGDFDFKNYSKGIAMVANMTKDKHPEMKPEVAKATAIADALYAAITIMKSMVKANPDAIQQLKMTDKPLQLPQIALPDSKSPPEVIPNPDYQTGQTTINPLPMIQDKPDWNQPPIPELPQKNPPIYQNPEEIIPNPDYPTGQRTINPLPMNQDKPQAEPTYPNSAPRPTISNIPQNKVQYNDWNAGNQAWQKNQNSVPPLNNNFAGAPQSIAYAPQNQAIQMRNDYNPPIQNTFTTQTKPTFMNSQQPIIPSNGNNFQYTPGDQAGFQQQRVNNPNGNQNGNQFGRSYSQSNVKVGQPGYQGFSGPSSPNSEQNRNQGTYNPQATGFNTQAENTNNWNSQQSALNTAGNQGTYNPQATGFNTQGENINNWNSQQSALNTAGNQGVGGPRQTGNYQQNSFQQNNMPFQGNQWK